MSLSGAGHSATHRVPFEFLYIDSGRIADYLAQLEGGEVGQAHRIKKEIRQEKGELSADGVAVGAEAQQENEIESTLVPTASSGLDVILRDVGPEIRKFEPNDWSSLDGLADGSLVRIRTRYLLSPGYIRPYVIVSTAATLAALFPRRGSGEHARRLAASRRHRVRVFADRIGSDPRITLDIDPPRPPKGKEGPVKVLLPIEYKNLTRERSLIEKEEGHFTGGTLTVVGKVARVFRGRGPSSGSGARPGFHPEFVDYATRESWQGPIRHTSKSLLERIGCDCRVVRAIGRGSGGAEARPLHGRRCLLTKLRRQTRLFAPGVVILPLAIYK